MAYGLRYTADFDSLSNAPLNFTLNIYKNGYVGTADTITLSESPAVQEWQDDDPFKPIKGSTLTIGIINKGDVSLVDFYSDNDNEFYVELLWNATGETLFRGYVLQDDCQEVLLDYAHVINIVATDNLGLLRDVSLGEAALFQGTPSTKTGILIGYMFSNTFGTNDNRVGELKAGAQFTIDNGAYAGTYNLLSISYNSFTTAWTLVVAETIPSAAAYFADITWKDPVPLTGYVSLLSLVRICLKTTNVVTGMRVMSELYPVGGATGRWLDDTYVLGESFLQDGSYMSCYDVLEKIMARFYASCFQAHGIWYIVRYGETFKINTTTPVSNRFKGYAYDDDFVYQVNVAEDVTMNVGVALKRFETGLLSSITRPVKSVKETFRYVVPEDLLNNNDLDKLGALLNDYTIGSINYKEYELLYWTDWDQSPGPFGTTFIRILTDIFTGEELDRYAVVKGPAFENIRVIQSNDIEVAVDDVIRYSFDYKTNISQPGAVNSVFAVRLTDGTNTYYLKDNGSWAGSVGYTFSVLAGDNTNVWHTVENTSNPIPINGRINVFLSIETVSNPLDETHYKNFDFTIDNSMVNIIGHVHTESQFNDIKNEQSQDIFLDNSYRSTAAGTLFLHTYTSQLRDKCTEWTYTGAPITFNRLGQLTTGEKLFTQYLPKTKYNGTLLIINELDRMITNFQVFYLGYNYPSDLNWLVPGSLLIDYRNNLCEFTLYDIAYNTDTSYDSWQMYEDFLDERLYDFRYLYEK